MQATSFVAGIILIIVYFLVPKPLSITMSLAIVATVTGYFLVRYCSRKSKVHLKIAQLETTVIATIAVAASLLIRGTAYTQKPQPALNEGGLFESAIK